jgi:hypothetical protein
MCGYVTCAVVSVVPRPHAFISTGGMAPVPEAHRSVFARYQYWKDFVAVIRGSPSPFYAFYLSFNKTKSDYERVLSKMAAFEYWMAQELDGVGDEPTVVAIRTAMSAELAAVHTWLCNQMAAIEDDIKDTPGWTPLVTDENTHATDIDDWSDATLPERFSALLTTLEHEIADFSGSTFDTGPEQ